MIFFHLVRLFRLPGAAFGSGRQATAELVERKLLNETERRQLDRAYDFLLHVRNELHYFNQRAADVIVISQQLKM